MAPFARAGQDPRVETTKKRGGLPGRYRRVGRAGSTNKTCLLFFLLRFITNDEARRRSNYYIRSTQGVRKARHHLDGRSNRRQRFYEKAVRLVSRGFVTRPIGRSKDIIKVRDAVELCELFGVVELRALDAHCACVFERHEAFLAFHCEVGSRNNALALAALGKPTGNRADV